MFTLLHMSDAPDTPPNKEVKKEDKEDHKNDESSLNQDKSLEDMVSKAGDDRKEEDDGNDSRENKEER